MIFFEESVLVLQFKRKDKSKMGGEAFIKDIKSIKSNYYDKNKNCSMEGKRFFKGRI